MGVEAEGRDVMCRLIVWLDSMNATTYVSEAIWEGKSVWIQGDRECEHPYLGPVCEVEPNHLYCPDCCGSGPADGKR